MEWILVYEKYTKAVDVICSAVNPYLDCGISLHVAGECNENVIEGEGKSVICAGIDKSLGDGYRIKVHKAVDGRQRIDVLAADEINLLYAAHDFKNKIIPSSYYSHTHHDPYYLRKIFREPLQECDIVSRPRIKERGIWTWGYVIYDYKRFIDNLTALKMNTLIIWNDYLPVNIREVTDYAHENGVKLYLGFAWGWDTSFTDISNVSVMIPSIVEKFEKEYADLGCDGIYFQSFTEVSTDSVGGVPVAETVTAFVNEICGMILKKHRDTKLLFGLHASSVKTKLDIIKKVDDRISIIWEDAGAFPYAYTPDNVGGFEETRQFTKKIRDLRGAPFGVVLKGLTCLNWNTFTHQKGSYVLGKADRKFIEKRTEEKRDIIRFIQAYWIKNAKYAHELIKELKSDTMVTVLQEDGMFEEKINYPVALYAEMLWDDGRETDDILCSTALRPDVDFV